MTYIKEWATPMKKNGSLSNHQLPIALLLKKVTANPLLLIAVLTSLICTGLLPETLATVSPEDAILQKSFFDFGSYSISVPSPTMFPEPWGAGV